MRRDSKRKANGLVLFFAPSLFLSLFFLVCSFTAQRLTDDFLKQLGIGKTDADEKITSSILGGYLDLYGVRNAKNIALGNRKAVALDLLTYTKKYVSSQEFTQKYTAMRNNFKPKETIVQTPEEMRASNIADMKKYVADAEERVKKADPAYKSIFEKSLEDTRQRQKEAEDPNNRSYVTYTKNYPQLVKDLKAGYERSIADWNAKYPENQILFVKKRLQEFLDITKDIDFSAELTEKNKKKIFVNPEYERKDGRWKMAFRAGKEVVQPAREFVEKWIAEIK
jgi:hypothetical protein